MEELASELARVLATGDMARAEAIIESRRGVNEAEYEMGRAALGIVRKDPETIIAHATRAAELAPTEALPEQYLGIAHMLRLRLDAAEAHCLRAVELSGGGAKARLALGSVYMTGDRFTDAIAVYRAILEGEPENPEALFCLGTASYKVGDYGNAVLGYSRAWALDPNNLAPLSNLLEMYAEMGRLLGAAAALELARPRSDNPQVTMALDMVHLNLTRMIAGRYPERSVVEDADRAVERVLHSAATQPARVRLAAARALGEIGRLDELATLIAPLADEQLGPADRGNLLYLEGYLASRAGDRERALAKWRDSLGADPERTDSAANAVSLLLEAGDPPSMTRIAEILARVPPRARDASPGLLFNEAIFLLRTGRAPQARELLERVRSMPSAQGQLTELATRAIGEAFGN